MPWMETDPMREREKFVRDAESGLWTMTELCERRGISRKTGYKILARYREEGLEGLKDRSRAPHSCPHRMSEEVEEALLTLKERYPLWGARKLRGRMETDYPELPLPAKSSVFDCLERHGKVNRRRVRRKNKHPGTAPLDTVRPNQVWPVDFKGQFPVGNGELCYPLTITDHYSRRVMATVGLTSTRTEQAQPVFERLFREVGLPEAIRSDNGVPFASTGIHGLCRLNVWWMQLRIVHQRILPASPQQNGQHERMHRDLKAHTARPPQKTMREQQKAFDRWRWEYNELRPHEALGDVTPNSRWTPSPRPFPNKIESPDYPGHFVVRRVSNAGTFRLNKAQRFLSAALAQHHIGFEEIDDGLWSIYFYDTLLARLDERKDLLSA